MAESSVKQPMQQSNNYEEKSSNCSEILTEENIVQLSQQEDIISAKIEEIFGKELVFDRPVKEQKYKSLASIYAQTKTIRAKKRQKYRSLASVYAKTKPVNMKNGQIDQSKNQKLVRVSLLEGIKKD